ncbi:MAG TPA: diacylglycerol kinase family protein [Chthoniobacterales bacterium]
MSGPKSGSIPGEAFSCDSISYQQVKITLLHNPKAGSRTFLIADVVRKLEHRGHQVFYVSIKDKDWRSLFTKPVELAIVAGGDGTVSRAAPWLAARKLPFCILPLGTANNCASNLAEWDRAQISSSDLDPSLATSVDLGIVTSSTGHHSFIESFGIGFLPLFMSEMRDSQKKNGSDTGTSVHNRLASSKERLFSVAGEMKAFDCEFLLDDEIARGEYLLIEVGNFRSIGPRLPLARTADPTDGVLNVACVRREQRKEWLQYLKAAGAGEYALPPVEERRCASITFPRLRGPVHVDGKVFSELVAPCCVAVRPGALKFISIIDPRQVFR